MTLMKTDEKLSQLCEVLDDIMTLDIAGRGSIPLLYKAARKDSKLPLSLQAANLLAENVNAGSVVFMTTGFLVRSLFSPKAAESDGPPGLATLARAIYKVLGAYPVVLTDPTITGIMEKLLSAAGFVILPPDMLGKAAIPSKRPTMAATVIGFSDNAIDGAKDAKSILQQFKPSAVISIERGGPNSKGIIHNSQGMDITRYHARVDLVVEEAYQAENGPVTIAVGDGGNEIGMGNIAQDLQKWLPYGTKCNCPCGSGIIPKTKVDVLVTSSVSNWGANAISSALAIIGGSLEAGPSGELEEHILKRSFDLGFIDGPTGVVTDGVDGMTSTASISVSELMYRAGYGVHKVLNSGGLWARPEV